MVTEPGGSQGWAVDPWGGGCCKVSLNPNMFVESTNIRISVFQMCVGTVVLIKHTSIAKCFLIGCLIWHDGLGPRL